MKHDRYYGERDSPFFRLNSRKKLASLLYVSQTKLESLACEEDLYYHFEKEKKNGGFRQVSSPRDDLKSVQKRIASLLVRIAPPDYLQAPVRGRSYIDNAAVHLGARSFRLLDIKDFYPSCTANKVIWFFHKRMQCSKDVSAVLRGIVTHNGSLPQGSPCSPILAYLCYVDMWEEIEGLVKKEGCSLSVYIDDLTISGTKVPEAAIWEIKKVLRKHGHNYSVAKERSKHLKPVEITGVLLHPDGFNLPNRHRQKIYNLRRQIETASEVEKPRLNAELTGREAQRHQILSRNSG